MNRCPTSDVSGNLIKCGTAGKSKSKRLPNTNGCGGTPGRPPGIGDYIEWLVKPIAVALKMDCLDEQQKLKPESPCGKRRDWANKQGRKIGIG